MFGRFGYAFARVWGLHVLQSAIPWTKDLCNVTRLQIGSGESTKILENTQANKCTDLVLNNRTNIMQSIFICRPTVLTRLEIRALNIVRSNLERLIRTLPKNNNNKHLFVEYKFIFHLSLCNGPLFCAPSNFETFLLYFSFDLRLCLHITHIFIVHLIHMVKRKSSYQSIVQASASSLQCIHNFKCMKICRMFVFGLLRFGNVDS